ncbi:hypothetical protein OS493_019803 [Desmophyllum pertusum]|uniref:Uncharacterized protein n=1 Tax=Desmophyllum pertusum TaxID=174260 RepID=A0A9X0CR33_9CNID|nr:hypothetical protein OS493_019803 [Desmophyllum pertusum]
MEATWKLCLTLLDNGAFISTVNDVHLTALQIASENGHLGVVKALYKAGADADQTALHHAAANNRLEVVKYLLQIGVKDKCMRCDGSFYWLKTTHRLQCQVKMAYITIPIRNTAELSRIKQSSNKLLMSALNTKTSPQMFRLASYSTTSI